MAAYYFNPLKQLFIAVFALISVSNHFLKFMATDSKKKKINRFTHRETETLTVSDFPRSCKQLADLITVTYTWFFNSVYFPLCRSLSVPKGS